MIITLNTRSEFMPGKLIVDKRKGVYGVVLYLYEPGDPIRTYKVKSLSVSKYWLIRKLQVLVIKKSFQ